MHASGPCTHFCVVPLARKRGLFEFFDTQVGRFWHSGTVKVPLYTFAPAPAAAFDVFERLRGCLGGFDEAEWIDPQEAIC